MRYHPSYKGLQQRTSRTGTRLSKNFPLFAIIAGFGLLFVGSVILFRNTKPEKLEVASSVFSLNGSPVVVNPISISTPDAKLIGVSSQTVVGAAARRVENGAYHLSTHANLPGIDRESQFYQVWLVRPVPYDYFSVGEMVTNDLGAFVLDWNGSADKDYSGYTDLVVTLQTRNGDPDPQIHIVEGEFGK